VLLIVRKNPPFKNHWAIPGGFIDLWEPLKEATARELAEETGVKLNPRALDQLMVAGDPRRDPRTRVISVVYLGIVRPDKVHPRAGDDAKGVGWFSLFNLPPLAFDHRMILKQALAYLRHRIEYYPFVLPFLPQHFTISAVRKAFEIIMGQPLQPQRFAHALRTLGILKPCAGKSRSSRVQRHTLYQLDTTRLRPAQLARLRLYPAQLTK
jgi:8-oxo-dGTP diphosphatase